jgi:hypothetical protein
MKNNPARWIALLSIIVGSTLTASAATFTSDTTISFNDLGYEGVDIIVTNCTLTVEGSHSFASLQLLNGAKLTQTGSDNGLRYSSATVSNEAHVLTATNGVPLNHTNVLVATVSVTDPSGAVVYTNGVDYVLQTDLSGNTTIGRLDGSSIPDGGSVLVSYVAQELLGPTGVNLAVTGDAIVELGGTIDVKGLGYANGFGPGQGGSFGNTGAGGGHGGYGGMSASNLLGGVAFDSILAPSDKGGGGGNGTGPGGVGGGAIRLSIGGLLRVDGIITANGANGTNNHSGGGAGGSIWMNAATITGSGSIAANGGDGEPTLGGGGGGGRIALYFNTNSFSGTSEARGGKGAAYGGAGTFYSKATSQSVGQLVADNGGHRGTNTLLSTTEAFDVLVSGGGVLTLTTNQTIGSLVVASNGWISCVNQSLNILADANIQSGGGIIADATSPTPGLGVGLAINFFGYYTAGGGGHGGFGAASKEGPVGGISYGLILQPSSTGSSGGDVHNPLFPSGTGGGAVLLTVGRILTVDGRISADGGRGLGQGGGGGSGGSIWITTSNILGSGAISANGGGTDGLGGGGAGGRIAVYFQTNTFTGPITAFGGVGGNIGAAGTVFIHAPGPGTLVVDNGGRSGTNTVLTTLDPIDVISRAGAVISQSGPWNLRSLTVSSNSYVLLTNSTLNISANASVASGAGIIADGTGFAGGLGSGAGRTGNIGGGGGGAGTTVGSGASHGGYGGAAMVNGASLAPGNVYDSSINPFSMGSGGGAGSDLAPTNAGGSGGGVIRMLVNGTLTVDGRISADGLTPANHNSGGGSGGSIALTLGTLSGSGVISASGGSGTGFGGCGGGGRIAIVYNSSTFSGNIRAYGGAGTTNSGGAGTLYIPNPGQPFGQITVDNGGIAGAGTDLGSTAGTIDLTVRGRGAVWAANVPPAFHNLTIASNSFYYLSNQATLTVSGNATVQSGGGIIADGAGSPANSGTGGGRLFGTGGGGGGGYGGYGGSAINSPGAGIPTGGMTYGLAIQPQGAGSGGGGNTFTNFGGSGGGSIHLTVNGNLSVDGRISADGRPGNGIGGGGSGGGLWISATNFLGSGSVSANGGSASLSGGGGGGGGRIAITTSPGTNGFTGTISASGGSGFNRGGAGTIYTRFGVQNIGQILVDNSGTIGTNTSILDSTTFDVTIRNGGSLGYNTQSATIRNLLINSNGWFVPLANQGPIGIQLNVTANATVQAGGGIIADGLGNGPASGQGAGRSATTGLRGGGGYGGAGAANPPFAGITYGSLLTPSDLGSGGGNATGTTGNGGGGAGGGAIRLTVTGTLAVDGRISATGNPSGVNSGGGSGGSLWLTVGTLAGGGSISANGGAGDSSFGGGGGGGRIALSYSTNLFIGPITAYGGGGALKGGAGTIYYSAKGNTTVNLVVVDNGGVPGTNTGLGSFISMSSDLSLKGGAMLYANSIFQVHNLTIASNASLSFLNNVNTLSGPTIGGDLTVQRGGLITADGAGYGGGQVSGPGVGGSVTKSGFGTTGGGGAHGGQGASSVAGAPGGNSYDSVSAPVLWGSNGGNGSTATNAGIGGGAIFLNVLGNISLEGNISANGTRGLSTGSGGGAGGSIVLTAHALTGTGIISANGGAGNGFGGGGGGGRIAIGCVTNSFAGAMTAFGGTSTPAGGAGTIYVQTSGQPVTSVLADNGGNIGTNTPLDLSQPVALTIQNGAVAHALTGSLQVSNLLIAAGGKFTGVPGKTNVDIGVLGNATIQAGGVFSLDGLGYGATNGPGAGTNFNGVGSGAGYGGNGGASSQTPGGAVYGSASQPLDRGSGGGAGSLSGSEGGGAIRLTVGGQLIIDGQLSANGNPGLQDDAGGGSGGSIWLAANSLSGSGTISANGGTGEFFDGGGGAGGRIALYSRSNNFSGALSVFGGDGFLSGQDGSVFFSSNFVAPTVISQTPVGTVSNAVSFVTLQFNTPINPASVSGADFQLITPAGPLVQSDIVVTSLGASSLRFDFPYQSLVGNYTFTAGPQIADFFGTTMSQVYTGAFSILLPVVQGFVTDTNGNPVPGVVLQHSSGFSSSTTSSNGEYAVGSPPGAYYLTPIKPGLMFVPGQRFYNNISGSISNENYLAVTTIAPNLAAELQGTNFVMHWTGISGVSYQLYFSTNLVDWAVSSAPVPGTNGPMQLPINIFSNDPMYFPIGFYRLGAAN